MAVECALRRVAFDAAMRVPTAKLHATAITVSLQVSQCPKGEPIRPNHNHAMHSLLVHRHCRHKPLLFAATVAANIITNPASTAVPPSLTLSHDPHGRL